MPTTSSLLQRAGRSSENINFGAECNVNWTIYAFEYWSRFDTLYSFSLPVELHYSIIAFIQYLSSYLYGFIDLLVDGVGANSSSTSNSTSNLKFEQAEKRPSVVYFTVLIEDQ